MNKPFHIVVAHDLNQGIGKNNAIPWHLPGDMAYFKQLTSIVSDNDAKGSVGDTKGSVGDAKGSINDAKDSAADAKNDSNNDKKPLASNLSNKKNVIIMGRKTWESLPTAFKPLPDRHNIVLSTQKLLIQGAEVAHSLDEALAMEFSDMGQQFVIGGAQIYNEALTHSLCDTIYVTKVYLNADCDTFFPEYKPRFTCFYASNIWVTKNGNYAFFRYKC